MHCSCSNAEQQSWGQRTIRSVYTCLEWVSINYQHLELVSKDLLQRCGWFISGWVTLWRLQSLFSDFFSKLLDRLEISPRLRLNQSSKCLKRKGLLFGPQRRHHTPPAVGLRGAGCQPHSNLVCMPACCSYSLYFTLRLLSVSFLFSFKKWRVMELLLRTARKLL